jgi:PHD/YefM family antitoxin component YafN of YafNO toxin-antitoxin module
MRNCWLRCRNKITQEQNCSFTSISALAHEKPQPIYITKNGEGDLVVMSIEAFEKREEIIKLRAKIELAEKSRIAGEPTFTLEQSKQRLEEIYERKKI